MSCRPTQAPVLPWSEDRLDLTRAAAARAPQHVLVYLSLRDQVLSARRANGADVFMPCVEALCAQYGVSRITVQSALRALEQEGLVLRRRGRRVQVRPQALSLSR